MYGQNLGSYLTQRRLRQARRLLQETQLTVNEIAHAVGFAEPGYFRRVFKRQFDMTATHFRRMHFRAHINVE